MYCLTAIPPVVPELSGDDDTSNFDDIPEPDAGEEFFPIPKVIELIDHNFRKLGPFLVL